MGVLAGRAIGIAAILGVAAVVDRIVSLLETAGAASRGMRVSVSDASR